MAGTWVVIAIAWMVWTGGANGTIVHLVKRYGPLPLSPGVAFAVVVVGIAFWPIYVIGATTTHLLDRVIEEGKPCPVCRAQEVA